MKELSIEEKAKAYDEALKVLHKYDGANIMFSQSLKEEMFPELKEDKDPDEKIRKALIKLVTNHASMDLFIEYDIHSYEALDWLEKQGKQKSTWNKKDEKMLSDIIKDLVHPWNEYILDRIEDEIKWLKNRLKFLGPQPKNEWSEEDNLQLQAAIDICKSSGHTITSDWLKSLKPCSQWKPSNEQIAALRWILNNVSSYNMYKEEISGLLKQLQKLRNE